MPQELRVVCCFQCRKFQSDIVKKAKKWTCKLCGAQQSLVKEYARGSGRECRLWVQQLSDGSLQADRMVRAVAERVLSGEMELPVLENPIREESDRLVASYEANRKMEGDRGSKWDSFCVSEDAEEGDVLTGKVGVEMSESSSWRKWGKGNGQKFTEEPKNSIAFESRRGFEQSSTTLKSIPMTDVHQMDKQDEKQFKWQSKNNLNQSNFAQPSKEIQENKKPLFSFKPKTSTFSSTRTTLENIDASQPKENIALKRTSDSAELPVPTGQSPMMSFAKKSKWANFNRPELEQNSPIATSDSEDCFRDDSEPLPETTQSPASSSKWSKFIPQTDEEDDEFT